MLSFDEATKLIFDNIELLGTIRRAIDDAGGYVLAEDIVSPVAVFPFRNSKMDGFALRSEWIEGCSKDNPVSLPYTTSIFAGDTNTDAINATEAAKIMTGAPVPKGYDTVVKFEDTEYDENQVAFTQPSPVGANIRPAGEDIEEGQVIFPAGYRLRAVDTGILASIGLREISVYRKPSCRVFCTGNELVSPGDPLKFGQIYNSNRSTIASLVTPFVESLEAALDIEDNLDSLRNALQCEDDIVITSGGVSAGDRDLVISAAESCGWTKVFHKARIKPGKPFFFARRGKQFLFGLPGNPLSTAVTCCIYVIPALKKMSGRKDYKLRRRPAKLVDNSYRKAGRLLIWPGRIEETGEGITAEFSAKDSSGALTAVLESDGLIFQESWDGNDQAYPETSAVPWNTILDF
jgi:molybdopterin molybdotransferase